MSLFKKKSKNKASAQGGVKPDQVLSAGIMETNDNVTLSDVLDNVSKGVLIDFKCPTKEMYKFLMGSTFQLYGKDDGSTPEELDDSTPILITVKKGTNERTIFDGVYSDVKNITETDPDNIQKLENEGVLSEAQHLYVKATPTSLASGGTKIDSSTVLLKLKKVRRAVFE